MANPPPGQLGMLGSTQLGPFQYSPGTFSTTPRRTQNAFGGQGTLAPGSAWNARGTLSQGVGGSVGGRSSGVANPYGNNFEMLRQSNPQYAAMMESMGMEPQYITGGPPQSVIAGGTKGGLNAAMGNPPGTINWNLARSQQAPPNRSFGAPQQGFQQPQFQQQQFQQQMPQQRPF